MKSGDRSSVDLYEAVKYDVQLHGARFIVLEFAAATLLAAALAIFELFRADASWSSVLAGLWFAGFAVNSLAVVLLARRAALLDTSTRVRSYRLHLYALELVALLLIPGAVALVAIIQRRAGDLSIWPDSPEDPAKGCAP